MSHPFCALVVDDEELYAQAIGRELSRLDIRSDLAFSGHEALALAKNRRYQVILLDQRLPDDDGLRIIPLLLARQPKSSLIMMTAYQAIPNAVQAIRQGADDYIVKETSLKPILDRVLEAQRRHTLRAEGEGWSDQSRGGLLGRSDSIVRVREQLDKIAQSPETTVLLTGETGVGKEVACRHLHRLSRPSSSPLITVDCLALPENLAESLLFGHEKGAFTGADQTRIGAFEEAKEGTVFLDEIGDMAALQGKLLRVLETHCFHRVGSTREIPLRARVVAATNQNLKELIKQGQFRLDLYQRLAIFPIQLPPLRERGEDILLLAEHFRSFFAEKLQKAIEPLSQPVSERLLVYSYPGNVRELKNIIERAVIITETGHLELQHLPHRVLEDTSGARPAARSTIPFDFVPGIDTLGHLEQRMIKQALRQAKNVKTEAAKLLGISRYQLLRRLEKYGIQLDDDET